jgi:hypothetical protein
MRFVALYFPPECLEFTSSPSKILIKFIPVQEESQEDLFAELIGLTEELLDRIYY